MQKTTKQYGFSLIEMVVVIIIISIIASMSYQLFFQSVSSYFTAVNTTDANWQGQIAMNTLSRSIRSIRSPNDISVATANSLTFINMNNNIITYGLVGGSIMQTRNNNAQILADGISSLTFEYFDKTGAQTATLTNIAFIRITINMTQKNVDFSFSSAVFPINFKS